MCKSIFSILLILTLTISCDDVPRDNILDPGNENSYSEPLVLVEAFVNTVHPTPYCDWALESLNTAAQLYPQQVVVAIYHRDLIENDSVAYNDPYNDFNANLALQFNAHHSNYVMANGGVPRAVPDVFINGAFRRITGASDANSVQTQLIPIMDQLISEKNQYTIEVDAQLDGPSTLSARCRVARLGNRAASDLYLKGLVISDFGTAQSRFVVSDYSDAKRIARIDAGEYQEVQFEHLTWNENAEMALFILTTQDEYTVLQSSKWEM